MKTWICREPGTFSLENAELPLPKKGHAILKIKRVGICGTDLHAFEGDQPYFSYPRILGHELAGEIVDIEKNTEFKKGEEVTITPYYYCGTCRACRLGKTNCCASLQVAGVHVDGGMCEFFQVPNHTLVKGRGLPVDLLALVEPLSIGFHAVARAQIQPGENVVVMGAGPIGLGVMLFAVRAGGKVIAVDINEHRLAFCRQHVSVHTLNPAKVEIREALGDLTGGQYAEVVMDATGYRSAIQSAFAFLAHGGRMVLVGLQKGDISFSHPEFHKREAMLMSSRNATPWDFSQVMEAIQKKEIDPAFLITHRMPFEGIGSQFRSLLLPEQGVIKAMVTL